MYSRCVFAHGTLRYWPQRLTTRHVSADNDTFYLVVRAMLHVCRHAQQNCSTIAHVVMATNQADRLYQELSSHEQLRHDLSYDSGMTIGWNLDNYITTEQ